MNEDFLRTIEFERTTAAAASTLVKDVEVGTLYVNAHLPGVWDRNYLQLDERARDSSADTLARLTDDLLAAAGVEHRKIYAAASDMSRRTLERFKELGWHRADLSTMAHHDASKLRFDHAVEELDVASYIPFEAACVDASPATDANVKDQLVSLVPLMARAARGRFFVVREGDEAVSGSHLYSDGAIAQVEDVMTLEPYRGKGYATAVVSRAVQVAIEEAHSLVFLIVERARGAKALYEKLGFEEIGRTIELVLEPR